MLLIGMSLVKQHYFGISKSQMQILIHMRMCIMRSDGLPQTLTDHEESVRQNVMICSILAAVVKRSNLGFCLSLRPSQLCLESSGEVRNDILPYLLCLRETTGEATDSEGSVIRPRKAACIVVQVSCEGHIYPSDEYYPLLA